MIMVRLEARVQVWARVKFRFNTQVMSNISARSCTIAGVRGRPGFRFRAKVRSSAMARIRF
jgi:hypothetical protein